MRRAVASTAAVLLLSSLALAQDAIPAGTSVGTVHDGRLVDGMELPLRGPGFHFASNRDNPSAHFGSSALVGALMRAAAEVAEQHPGSDHRLEDIAFEQGGPIRGHGSHRSGRDADVAYYATDAEGAPHDPSASVWFRRDGRSRGAGTLRFDAARTALFLHTLLRDRAIRVQFVFMAPHLQRAVLAESHGGVRARLEAALRTPRGRRVDPHADHFHVRIRCPRADRAHGCR